MADRSPHQEKIIGRYYENRDDIMLARLGEIVSELYLSESDRKRGRLWKRAEQAMKALNVPSQLAQYITQQRDPEILARNLRDWLDSYKRAKPDRRKPQ